MSIVIYGRRAIVVGTVPITIPTLTYENLEFSPFVRVRYDPALPNISVDGIYQDIFIAIDNTSSGDTGLLKLYLVTGTERVIVNNITLFTKPTIPGWFITTYTNTSGILTFN